ncbi:hypothetical protein [Actinoplanes flavus]|uniref:Uncharacterized protein n=1 Tax=Actinoplanes flavus TaxID=2820290 RepID=A0ABS3UTY0_9ACTN|nr:hypothetical protein [Actinoplanes flavus]MBO3742002.1 hypothetical protein [Actinoplanes flavus]
MTRPLTLHLIRAVPWWPFAAAVALAVVAQLPVFLAEPPPTMIVIGLRLAAAVLGAAAGFALPDLMASTVISPTPRWRRQWLRLMVLLVPSVLVWTLLYLAVRDAAGPVATWPHGFVILQAAVCGLLPVAAAAVGARYRDEATGALSGPAVQGGVLVVSLFFTDRNSPWAVPAGDDWTTAQRCWPVALALVLVTLLAANRERPGSRPAVIGRRRFA